MKPYLSPENNYVYYERDDVTNIFFLKRGECGLVLPKHKNLKYINISPGNFFGVIDIVGSCMKQGTVDCTSFLQYKGYLKRQFTVKSQQMSELLTLNIDMLDRMRIEFIEAFDDLFFSGFKRLNRSLKVKMAAINYCKTFMKADEGGRHSHKPSKKLRTSKLI